MAAKKKAPTKKTAAKARKEQLRFDSAEEMQEFIRNERLAGGDRLVVKGSVVNDAPPADPDPKEEEEPQVDSGNGGTWGPKPSVAAQAERHPTTVRDSAAKSCQLVLSDNAQLETWNKLQERMHPASAPQIRISEYERVFSQSLASFVVYVSYSELSYQQI